MFDAFKSVVVYLWLFGISYLLFATSEKMAMVGSPIDSGNRRDSHSGWVATSHIPAFITIFLLSLVAALRADTVGVDTAVYPDVYMRSASFYSSFAGFLSDPNTSPMSEPLHALLVWVCSRFTADKAPLLFFYQLLTVTPVYFALYNLRDKLPISIGMAVYLFFFYNNSLNMMRQSVACALLLLAFSILIKKRKFSVKFIICIVAAVLFHRSGIYGAGLLLAASLVGRIRHQWLKVASYVLVVFFPLVVTQLLQLLIGAGLADSHVLYYADVFIYHNEGVDWFVNPLGGYSLSYLVMYSWLVFLPLILRGLFSNQKAIEQRSSTTVSGSLWAYLRSMNLIGYFIYVALLFNWRSMYGIRFSVFLDFMLILSLPLACTGTNGRTKKAIVLLSLLAIWFVWIVYFGWSGSQIYLFRFE